MQNIHKISEHSQFVRITCDHCGKEEEFPPVGKGYFSSISQQQFNNCRIYLKEKGWVPSQQTDDKPIGLGEHKDFCCEECYKKYMEKTNVKH